MKQLARSRPFPLYRAVYTTIMVVLALVVTPTFAVDSDLAEAQDPEAKSILMKMAGHLAKAPAFSVTLSSSYDAIQEDGQRIEFGEKRRILLQRPNRFRVEVVRSDGDRALLLFDGQRLTAFKARDNVFARTERSGTADEAIVYIVRNLQMTLPLARMFRTDFPTALQKKIVSIRYVEENFLFDVITDCLVARMADVDFQIWIAQGEQPLPHRVVLTYKNAPGQPQFRAELTDWDISPKVEDDDFSFKPPEGAEQIPLLTPVRPKGSLPIPKGDKQ
ncbi:MAG: DUF2092 domain-containing protein [Desulfobacterales bacterium]